MQREAAHTAVDIPHRPRCGTVHPLAHLLIQLRGDLRVRLEERPRSHAQRDLVDGHDQLGLLGEHDFFGTLEHGLVLGLDVHGDHVCMRYQFME